MKGWECPKCGQCFAPHIDRCPDCVSVKTIQPQTVLPLTGSQPDASGPWTPPGKYGVVPCGPLTSAPPADTTYVKQETTGCRTIVATDWCSCAASPGAGISGLCLVCGKLRATSGFVVLNDISNLTPTDS